MRNNDGILVSYATWLARHGEDESDLLPLINGIGFNSKDELKEFLSNQLGSTDSPGYVRFDTKYPFLDIVQIVFLCLLSHCR
jgi:hypothetical protein